MSKKELYRDDLLNRFSGHTFTETPTGDLTLVEFKDAGSVVIGAAKTMVVDDAYQLIRQDLVGDFEVVIVIDETQRDALTGTITGTTILNTDGAFETYDGVGWI